MNRKERRQKNRYNKKITTNNSGISSSSYNSLIKEAQHFIDNSDLDRAKSLLKKAVRLNSQKSESYHMQALIAYSEGYLDLAGEMIL